MSVPDFYFDYNATTPLDNCVNEAFVEYYQKYWFNPSSGYDKGVETQNQIKISRKQIADLIGCENPDKEITFTSGGTESNNWVIHSSIETFKKRMGKEAKPHIITSNIEHPAIDLPLKNLHKNGEIDLTFVEVNKQTGYVNEYDVIKEICSNTCLITIMLANNETGIIQPIGKIANQLHDVNVERANKHLPLVLFHTDAAQAIGKIPVDVKQLRVDYLTIAGHKFYGPRIGALYHNCITPIEPLFYGGGQEYERRPGTENTGMIIALGRIAEKIHQNSETFMIKPKNLKDFLVKNLKKHFGDDFKDNFEHIADDLRLPNTLSGSFKNVLGYNLVKACSEPIYVSTQAACHSQNDSQDGFEGSPILLKSGIKICDAKGTLRISVGMNSTEQNIIDFTKILHRAYKRLI